MADRYLRPKARLRIVARGADGHPVRGQDARVLLVYPDGTVQDLTERLGIVSIRWGVDARDMRTLATIVVRDAEIDADTELLDYQRRDE